MLGDVGPDLIIMMMMIIFKLINKVPTLTRHIHSCMRPTGRRRALRLDLDWPVVSPDMANMATDLGGDSIGYVWPEFCFHLKIV